jgi:CPA1 family monovalent cation:H+ antiporter
VLAVVICGLTVARYAPRLISAESRLRTYSFWGFTTYVLNAALFVIVGIELPKATDALESHTLRDGILAVAVATLAVVLSRVVWSYTSVGLIRTLDRRPSQRARRVDNRRRVPTMWAGVRGGVSLAAALAVPLTTDAGDPFLERDFIIFVTGGTVLLTLVVQGMTLPRVIRWAQYPPDDAAAREHDLARHALITASLDHLDVATAQTPHQQKVVEAIRHSLEKQRATLPEPDDAGRSAMFRDFLDFETELRLDLVGVQRDALTTLRDNRQIDGAIYLRLESVLDSEERSLRLNRDARDGGLRGPE